MAIHTSAIVYTRGISNTFFLVSQANNTIPVPMNVYLRNFQFYNRNVTNTTRNRRPWRP